MGEGSDQVEPGAEQREPGAEQVEPGAEQRGPGRRRLLRKKGVRTLLVVGVCALLLGGFLGYITLRDTVFADPASATTAADPHRFVSEEAGFSVDAPKSLEAEAKGHTVKFSSEDKSLVVNVGPGEQGGLKTANKRFLARMKGGYSRFEIMATEPMQVDGHPALSTSGQAVNANGVQIRFVVLVVSAETRNYTIAAYAAHDSDPAVVLPLVNAVANGFHVLPAEK